MPHLQKYQKRNYASVGCIYNWSSGQLIRLPNTAEPNNNEADE